MAIVQPVNAELRKLFEIKGVKWESLVRFFAVLALGGCAAAVFVSPWWILAGIGGILLLILAYFRSTWVVAFLAAYMPFEPFLLKFIPDELYVFAKYFSEGLIYILLAAVLFRLLVEGKRRPATPIDLPFVLLLVTAVASAVANLAAPTVAILGIRQIIRFMLLFFAVAALGPSRAFVRKLMVIMLAVVMFQAVLGIVQEAAGGSLDAFLLPSQRLQYENISVTTGGEEFWTPGTRVFATLGRYDQLGTFLAFFMLLAVGLIYEVKKGRFHTAFFVLMGVSAVALAMTYSRASWFGFMLGLFWIAVFLKKDKKVLFSFIGVAAVLAAYILYSGIVVRYLVESPNQTLLERFYEAFSYERYRGEYYGLGRVYWIVQTPLTVVAQAPLFGWGPGQYGGGAAAALGNTAVYDKLGLPFGVYGTEGYIDNNWLSIWGELGTLGLALYIWMFVALWRVADKVRKESKDQLTRGLALGFMGGLLAISLQAFLGTYLEVRTIAIYFWLFAAIIVSTAQREKLLT